MEKISFDGGGSLGVMAMQGRKVMEETKDIDEFV